MPRIPHSLLRNLQGGYVHTWSSALWVALMRGSSLVCPERSMYSGSRVRAAASSHCSVASRIVCLRDVSRSTALLTALACLVLP